MNSVRRTVRIIFINAIVFIALLGAIELFYRVWRPSPAEGNNGLWQNFHTYVMFLTAPGTYNAWTNQNTKEIYPANVVTNSLGFNDHHEFAYTGRYEKAPNERVVLFTSGSTGWGVGATSTDTTVSGRMQFYLNSLQNAVKYTVINMSAGSWIAYQQFIALDLWGEWFQPDWIVAMDGHNDASVGCQYSQGVANPLYFATIKSYVDAYLFSTAHPVFYRGWLENQLIRHSAAYRGLSAPVVFVVREIAFQVRFPPGGRKVECHSMGEVFPNKREERVPYFIDGAHLSDKGADVLGKFYADRILASGAAIR
jgi:lysophospholipase L1-like esterase